MRGAMLALASLNRFRLTPAFERSIAAADHHGALRGLRRSLAVEASCAVAILALALVRDRRAAGLALVLVAGWAVLVNSLLDTGW